MSKLAALAKKRASNNTGADGSNKSVDILNRLSREDGKLLNGGTGATGSELASRANGLGVVGTGSEPTTRSGDDSSIRKSKISRLRFMASSETNHGHKAISPDNKDSSNRSNPPTTDGPTADTPTSPPTPASPTTPNPCKLVPEDSPIPKYGGQTDPLAELDLNVSVDDSLISSPKLFFVENQPTTKRRRLNDSSIYKLITNQELPIETIKTAQKNFDTESPDDKVQNAQKQAFNEFEKLDIKEPSVKSNELPKQKIKITESDLSSNPIFQKPHKSFVVIGHVDAGKSTLMGRILLDLNIVDLKTVNKLIKESESIGKGSFALAWLMDQTNEERSRGVTVDIVATNFETTNTRFTAIDAPGHKDFVPQMINGVCQADMALLIIDSITGEFESGFQLDGQTKEHTLIAKNLGINKICCIINKLDKENWSDFRFEFIKSQLLDYLVNDIGFAEIDIEFIPLSGLTGNNVVKREILPEFNWYKGKSLLQYLESVDISSSEGDNSITKVLNEPFTFVISDILDVSNQEFSVRGKILSGIIQANDQVKFLPLNETLKVSKICYNEKAINYSITGEIIDIYFPKKPFKEKFDELVVGDILTNSPEIKSVSSFECKLTLFNLSKPLLIGTPFVLFRNNLNIPAKLSKIISIENSTKKKKHLVSNQIATVEVTIVSDRLLPISTFEDSQLLGKVVIRKEGVTIGAGTVMNLTKS